MHVVKSVCRPSCSCHSCLGTPIIGKNRHWSNIDRLPLYWLIEYWSTFIVLIDVVWLYLFVCYKASSVVSNIAWTHTPTNIRINGQAMSLLYNQSSNIDLTMKIFMRSLFLQLFAHLHFTVTVGKKIDNIDDYWLVNLCCSRFEKP